MSGAGTDVGLWIRTFEQAAPRGVGLVCLPHAGGAASFFAPLARALAPSVQVLAVQYPGRQDRRAEPCLDDLVELAGGIVGALKSWMDAPLALFGHSMGAVLAFEVARRFERELGIIPRHFFASGREAPSPAAVQAPRQRDDHEILAELQLLDGTDRRLLQDEELLRMVMPAVRGDYRAIERYVYQPGPRLACPITVLTGDRDSKASLDGTRAWRDHTSGPFDHHVFPGGHFYLIERQSDVVEVIRPSLTYREVRA